MKRPALAMPMALAMALLPAAANGWGQCVMCFRTAAAQNAARAHLLNMGIVLLGLPPFVILAGFLCLAWRRSRTFATVELPDETVVPES
jgi:predicted anti-sigma-YlaC factor YlaD